MFSLSLAQRLALAALLTGVAFGIARWALGT